MRELSLFTGAGGGILGSKLLGWKTIGYVEIEDYCQRIIAQRIADGILDQAPIFGDIRAFIDQGYAECYRGVAQVVSAGFPCQPFSVAGKRQGEMDERNMWPHTIEVIRRVRPRFCLLENVPNLLAVRDGAGRPYFGTILGDLSESGYHARWKVISAAELGAPHKRNRLWIVALPNTERCDGRSDNQRQAQTERRRPQQCSQMADARYAESQEWDEITEGSKRQPCNEPASQGRVTWWDNDPADMGDAERIAERPGLCPEESPEIGGRRSGDTSNIHNSMCGRHGAPEGKIQTRRDGPIHSGNRPTQPRLGRVAHGVAHRVDRLKAIGNGIVPSVYAKAWEILTT